MAGWIGGRFLRNSDDIAQLAPGLKSTDETAFDIFFKNQGLKTVAPDQAVPALDPSTLRFTLNRLEDTISDKFPSDYIPPDPRLNGGGPPPLFSDN